MRNLFTITLLAGLLSIPSTVIAEASWYGSFRVGVSSEPREGGGSSTGVDDGYSRWGIKGGTRVAEGLIAVYRFETGIDSTDASSRGGRLSFVGLRGRFGMVLAGQIWSASYTSVGTMIDNSFVYGQGETSYRIGDAVSYIVEDDNLRLQADAIMDSTTKKTVDSYEIGAKIDGLMKTGSVAISHVRRKDKAVIIGGFASGTQKTSSNYLVGEYGIGDVTMYLGTGKHTAKNDGCLSSKQIAPHCIRKGTRTSTYAGIRGGISDTGIEFVFQTVRKKVKSTNNASSPVTTKTSMSPRLLGISRSLGGGASIHFETSDPDEDGVSSSTGIWLKVDF